MSKKPVHYYDSSVLREAPISEASAYWRKGLDGAICGYVRPRVTYNKKEVTCKLCLREMKKKGLLN